MGVSFSPVKTKPSVFKKHFLREVTLLAQKSTDLYQKVDKYFWAAVTINTKLKFRGIDPGPAYRWTL